MCGPCCTSTRGFSGDEQQCRIPQPIQRVTRRLSTDQSICRNADAIESQFSTAASFVDDRFTLESTVGNLISQHHNGRRSALEAAAYQQVLRNIGIQHKSLDATQCKATIDFSNLSLRLIQIPAAVGFRQGHARRCPFCYRR